MDSDFMEAMTLRVASEELEVIRFEFPYMIKRRRTGKAAFPDRQPLLLDTWRRVIDQLDPTARLFIGGKSMGGRMASLVCAEMELAGLVCLGFPFHAPGKPVNSRIDHFPMIKCKTLILQGERDPFGNAKEVNAYNLSSNIKIKWLQDGNHDFKPRVITGLTIEDNMDQAARAITTFVSGQ